MSQYLFDLRASLYNKYKIEDDEDGNLVFVLVPGERKINKFAQRIFRSLKVYDHIINFIMQNLKLMTKVRTSDYTEMGETERQTNQNINKIFKR